jgi:S-(hydroxymethyl)glutathione dehydrogenase/alcohol dehydrogenase
MRAAVLRQRGDDKLDVVVDAEAVAVGPGEVRVRIRATGVCHTDLSVINGVIPSNPPVVLGHEGAGEITEVGSGVPELAVGDHVVVAWVPPCGHCHRCLEGQPHLCNQVSTANADKHRFEIGGQPAFAFAGVGTMAEEITIPHQSVVRIDRDVPWDVASLLGCGVTTGIGAAINAAKVTPGSSVVVFGAGGIGISIIQGAKVAGAAEIVAVDPFPAKREGVRRFGATHAVAPEGLADLQHELTGGEGFDFAFEAVGTPATIRATYDAARRGGTACIVGAGGMSEKVEFSPFELFATDRKLVGTLYGSSDVRRDFPRIVRLWKAGRIDLEGMITQKLPLEEVNRAFDDMQGGKVIRTVIDL